MNASLQWLSGKALWGGAAVEDVSREFGTPFYLYDEVRLLRQHQLLRAALPGVFEIFYSVKANPHPKVIDVFLKQGSGCEIASGGEYELSRQAGGPPEKIVFAGPGKSGDELEYVLAHGIGEIHLEGYEEIELLGTLAKRRNVTVNVAARLNPSAAVGGGLLMGGQPTAFGFPEESLHDVIAAIARHSRLKLRGVHLYTGTQILDAEVLLAHWEHALELAIRTADVAGHAIATIDVGGGLGIPYFAHEKNLDLEVLAKGAAKLVAKAQSDSRVSAARFMVEPGRFLAGPAGLYVCQVRSVKNCRGSTFVVVDGGMHHHLAASGNLGQVIRRDYPMLNLSQQTGPEAAVSIVGPLCTPIDTLARKVNVVLPRAGDMIGILQSGAYGLTASPVRLLSHPTPAEVLANGSGYQLITPRQATFGERAIGEPMYLHARQQ